MPTEHDPAHPVIAIGFWYMNRPDDPNLYSEDVRFAAPSGCKSD